MESIVGNFRAFDFDTDQSSKKRLKWYFSAAAACIKFLGSLSVDARSHVRRVILNENYKGVAEPQCHAQGLIPYCQENPNLRIERHIDLWRAMHDIAIPTQLRNPGWMRPEKLYTHEFTSRIRIWIEEAFALLPAGMPSDSFSLVFDAPPNDLQIMFDILKRAALWQEAFEECCKRELIDTQQGNALTYLQTHACHISDDFVQAMKDLIQNPTTLIRFDALPGDVWNVEPLIEQSQGWSLRDWSTKYYHLSPRYIDPDPSLPSWREIQLEYAYFQPTATEP